MGTKNVSDIDIINELIKKFKELEKRNILEIGEKINITDLKLKLKELKDTEKTKSMFRKLKYQDVIDIVSNGLKYQLFFCPSNQTPSEDSCYVRTDYYINRTREDFKRYLAKQKERFCNEKDGKTLKYYIKITE